MRIYLDAPARWCRGRRTRSAPAAAGEVTSFPRSVQARDGETVVFSWIRYESREQRDRVNAAVMADPRLPCPRNMPESETPFDAQRMFWGGFEVLVER